jgi:pre-mRNA-splicing factor ATP-dependent RNA helicase DHX15/PRP43
MDVKVGNVVGLKHRDRDLTNYATRLDVVTDGKSISICDKLSYFTYHVLGSLLVAARSDVDLRNYGAIVIDEAHQHTVPTDLLLGLLKLLAARRKDDLKIIIMSATIDADLFLKFLPGSVLATVSGRTHKVSVLYLAEPPTDDTIVETILQVHLTGRNGNILVFVSGVREMHQIIEKVQKALNGPTARFGPLETGPLECWPLHAKLSPEAQDDAVETIPPVPQNGQLGRKLLIATNIAEASVTLTGVTHVIDSCKFKSKIWNPRNESWCLREQWISKAVARQRAGRAGRTREGVAYRMCTEGGFHEQLLEHSVPAIKEGDMLSECLSILKMGQSPLTFPYIVAPATETIVKALEILSLLGAVDARGSLTPLGEDITRLPVNVYSAVVLLESPQFGCSDEMISLVSMMEATDGGSDLFIKPTTDEEKAALKEIRQQFCHASGDHLTLFNVYMAWTAACATNKADRFLSENMLKGSVLRYADQIALQLFRTLLKVKNWRLNSLDATKPGYYIAMLKALAAGNYLRIAKRESSKWPRLYVTVRHGAPVRLTADTSLGGEATHVNEWVIYNEFHSDGVSTQGTIRLVSAIVPELFISARPEYWYDTEFLPEGPIRDQLVKIIARMTGITEKFIRGGMPKNPAAGQS